MKSLFTLSRFSAALLAVALAMPAVAVPIDLNPFDFYATDGVTFPGDGSAVITEVDGESTQLLENDPYLGDPILIAPAPGGTVSFDYVFDDGGGDDEFGAFILGASGVIAALTFFTDASGSGSVVFDLSAVMDLVVGISFQLNSLELLGSQVLGSTVTVYNVQFEVASVPEPTTLALALVGLLLVIWSRRPGAASGRH